MTQTTESPAMKALETAQSLDEIAWALHCLERITDMCKAFKNVTGEEYSGRVVGVKKGELIYDMARRIKSHRYVESFKAMDVSEKYIEITERRPERVVWLVSLCREYEVVEIAEKLGMTLPEGRLYDKQQALWNELIYRAKKAEIDDISANGAEHEEIRREFFYMDKGMKEIFAVKAGIEVNPSMPDDEIANELTEHYFKVNFAKLPITCEGNA